MLNPYRFFAIFCCFAVGTGALATPRQIVDVRPFLRGEINSQQRSEKLTEMGEKLLISYSFMYADRIFDLALSFDQKNRKAQFYKHLVSVYTPFKGFFARIKPIIDTYKGTNNYGTIQSEIERFGKGNLFRYLTENPDALPLVKNELGFQRIAEAHQQSLLEVRRFLANNMDLKFSMAIPSLVAEVDDNPFQGKLLDGTSALWRLCDVKVLGENIYQLDECPLLEVKSVQVDRVDLEILRILITNQLLKTVLTTSYQLNGYFNINQRRHRLDKVMSDQEYVRYFNSIPEFGILKSSQKLHLIKELGVDLYSALSWLTSNTRHSCPDGGFTQNRAVRPNQYFGMGIFCIDGSQTVQSIDRPNITEISMSELLSSSWKILNGGSFYVGGQNETGQIVTTKAQLIPFLKNPPSNIKSLLPINFNACGNGMKVDEEAWNILLPDRKTTDFLSEIGRLGLKCDAN
ncbi:MAG: hypothetical protein IPL83_03890 [Bdellovibrionales bacterium]|nr:hypothetical protein [Bdellovibrionales bacterium]